VDEAHETLNGPATQKMLNWQYYMPEHWSRAPMSVQNRKAILPARNGSHDEKRLRASGHLIGQRRIRGFMRQIFRASKESYVGPSLLGHVIPDSALQHWIPGFESVQNRSLRGLTFDLECDVAVHARERSKMSRKYDLDHASV
jgi:hypothetical protein